MKRLTKQLRRIVNGNSYGDLVITLTPEGIQLREKGHRTTFLLPYGAAYTHAAWLATARTKPKRVPRGLLHH